MKIFFDFDGTLTDISKRHYEVYSRCVAKYGGNLINRKEYWDNKRANVSWYDMLLKSDIDPELEVEFLSYFTELIELPEFLRLDTLLDSSLGVLKKLSTRHELILISLRRNHDNLLDQLDELGISTYFTRIESGHSETVEQTLTKKADIISAMDGVGGAVIIGDTEADISAGKHLGIRTIAVLSGIRNKSFIQSFNPDAIIDSIADLDSVLN